MISSTINLIRLRQWTKNLLVFAALLFTAQIGESRPLVLSIGAFFAMCLVSSAVYVFNDLLDIEKDRIHPTKRNRPLPSGQLPPAYAIAVAVTCLGTGLSLGMWVNLATLLALISYLILQVLYNGFLKTRPIADVFALSLGFLIRAIVGAVAIKVAISGWLLLCTFSLALLLGAGKRRHEFVLMGEVRGESRASLLGYSQQTLDALVILAASCAALFYGVYSIESKTASEHPGLILTVLFVFYGIARYVYLIFSVGEGGEPDSLLVRDRHLILTVVLFIVVAILAMKGLTLPFIEPGGVRI